MSKSSRTGGRQHHPKKGGAPSPPVQRNDRAIYFGLAIIGAFYLIICFLILEGTRNLGTAAVVYIALMGWFTNLYAYGAYRGHHLAPWQQSLARLPLHFVGFGSKNGKPLEAAHDERRARNAVIVSAIVSVLVLAGLVVLLVPGIIRK